MNKLSATYERRTHDSEDGSNGECFVNDTCDGPIKHLQDSDLTLAPAPMADAKCAGVCPFTFGTAALESAITIFSENPASEDISHTEVLVTMTVIEPLLAFLYFAWLFFVFLVLRKGLGYAMKAEKKELRKMDIFWQLARVYLNQVNFTIDLQFSVIKAIVLLHVLLYYALWAYFGAAYSTELTQGRRIQQIDTMEDLANSSKVPFIIKGDPIMNVLLHSKRQSHKVVYDRFMDCNRKSNGSCRLPRGFDKLDDTIQRMMDSNAVFLGPEVLSPMLISFYCNAIVSRNRPSKMHLSLSSYGQTVFGYAFRRQSDPIAIARLNAGLTKLFEGHLTFQMYSDLEKVLQLPYSIEKEMCKINYVEEKGMQDLGIHNVKWLSSLLVGSHLIALVVMVYEVVKKW